MPTLVLSTWSLPSARALADAAQEAQWDACVFDEMAAAKIRGKVVFYGGTDLVLTVAERFHLALLEPPFDLLARLPLEFRLRAVEYGSVVDMRRLTAPAFVKPADALNKTFDAGTYARASDIQTRKPINSNDSILLAEPVEWSAEYRCFIVEGKVAAWSPYISFGRPAWKPFGPGTLASQTPPSVEAFWGRLYSHCRTLFPPAFVMDVGLIDERGWAVVEFNPVWCSGVLGADPRRVLAVLERACQDGRQLSAADRRWVIDRSQAVDSL